MSQLSQAQIRNLFRDVEVLKYLGNNLPNITSQPIMKSLPPEMIATQAQPRKKRMVHLRYNKPQEPQHSPEELVISGALNQHRLLDQLKEHHQNHDWKSFYQVAERVLRVKTSNPIVRTILADEAGPVVEQDEVERLIAHYFDEVYAIDRRSQSEEE